MLSAALLDELRFVLAPGQAAPRNQLDAGRDEQEVPDPLADLVRELALTGPVAGELDAQRERRGLFDSAPLRADEDVAADGGTEGAHDLAQRRGEDVDAAHDQHVVGAAEAADPGAR